MFQNVVQNFTQGGTIMGFPREVFRTSRRFVALQLSVQGRGREKDVVQVEVSFKGCAG